MATRKRPTATVAPLPLGVLRAPANSDLNEIYTELRAAQQDVKLLRVDLEAAEEREAQAYAERDRATEERENAEVRADEAVAALEDANLRIEGLESLLSALGVTGLALRMLEGADRASIDHDARCVGLLGVVL